MALDTTLPPLAGRQAVLPDGLRVYAVGDVHGRLDLLHEIEALIADDARSRPPSRIVRVMLGDYVDRGPDSRGVIAHLAARADEPDFIALRGNHEAYVLDVGAQANLFPRWCLYGGRETLASYGFDLSGHDDAMLETDSLALSRQALASMPGDHLRFIAQTRLSWRCGDYLFVHAGIRPGTALDDQNPRDLLWIRDDFLESDADFGCVVVHGHTPGREPVIRANRIGIDTRAYATGVLTCLVLEGPERRFLQTGPRAQA